MQKIDAHQHFWLYHPVKDGWITSDMAVIQRDFLPADLWQLLDANQIDGCLAVQASQTTAENAFLLQLASANPFIKGIVGWVDLRAHDIDEQLRELARHVMIKGFRHVLQAEEDDFMLGKQFMNGISFLNKHQFTYDILINARQLMQAEKLVAAFPKQGFVIDHLAKPGIKKGEIADWQSGITAIAKHQNVYCKVSGFCTEADWDHWQPADVKRYLDVVFDVFGIDRMMFGSDWPVNLLAGGYSKTITCLKLYMAGFSNADQEKFWGGNAIKFYDL